MRTPATTLPENGSPSAAAPRRRWPRLRDARIRSKLALILVVPVAAVLALATARLADIGSRAYEADRVKDLIALAADVSELTHAIHHERMAAARLVATRVGPTGFNEQVAQTNERVDRYIAVRQALTDLSAEVQATLRRIDEHLRAIDATRSEVVDRGRTTVSEVVLRYGVIIADLVAYVDVLAQITPDRSVANSLRAVAVFARAKAGASDEEAVAYAARASRDTSVEQYAAFVATQTSQQEALLTFFRAANPDQRSIVNNIVTGDPVTRADQVTTELNRAITGSTSISAEDAANAIEAVVDLMRWAELRLEARLISQARAAAKSVTRQATLESVLVLLTLVIAVALTVTLARSLNTALRSLREGALAVASRDLPDAVSRLRDVRNLGDGGASDILREVRDPIPLDSRDEIGQVAQAFNVVHKEAVRIAVEQAALRASVAATFLNLARRSQSLVDRMIGELDRIERGEEDPQRLAELFELDHLATRMRRNDENLLILAGADSSTPRREDALLVDALRAAQSEVEVYNRIEFGDVDPDIGISALAVNDVVRLVAELLDNATRFSPPTTVVVADARRVRDHVVIEIEDRGLGMSEQQMQALNRQISQPPSVDVAAVRLMGLAVVGRLATRYGIEVELRPNPDGGTVAQIVLPSTIVVRARRPTEPSSGPPERVPQPVENAPSGSGNAGPRADTATITLLAAASGPWRQPDGPLEGRPPQPSPAIAAQVSSPPITLAAAPRRVELEARPVSAALSVPAEVRLAEVRLAEVRPVEPESAAERAAVVSPTMAYRGQQAVPTVGFVSADGTPLSVVTHTRPDTSGWGAALAAMPPPEAFVEDRTEAPIFRQIQANWFLQQDRPAPEEWSMPTAGYAPPPAPASSGGIAAGPLAIESAVAAQTMPAVAERGGHAHDPTLAGAGVDDVSGGGTAALADESGPGSGAASVLPRPRRTPEAEWRTPADEGWQRARAAAEPTSGGITRSGLPRRVPRAQLVPGGVRGGPRERTRRTPDDVRGLLSAYHRGVQRGRTSGSAEASALAPKENDQ